MFSPARPPEMWSRLAMKRAAWNGSQNVDETEETRPMCSVTCEIAARVVIGSRNQVGPAVSASVRAA